MTGVGAAFGEDEDRLLRRQRSTEEIPDYDLDMLLAIQEMSIERTGRREGWN